MPAHYTLYSRNYWRRHSRISCSPFIWKNSSISDFKNFKRHHIRYAAAPLLL